MFRNFCLGPLPKRSFCWQLFLMLGFVLPGLAAAENSPPAHLRCEAMPEPLGIDVAHPILSWQLQDTRRGAKQTAYQIRVASSAEGLTQDHADVWDSGRVASDESVNVAYAGPALESRPPLLLASTRLGPGRPAFRL